MNQSDNTSVSVSITVPAIQKRTFDLFVDKFSSWYPEAYTWSGEKLVTIELGSAEGERCFERGPHNFEMDWGRVLTYQPPERIVFTWQINYDRQPVPDPEKASVVDVQFHPSGQDATTVRLEHRNFEKYGENGSPYKEAMASPQGWPFILNQFNAFVASQATSDKE